MTEPKWIRLMRNGIDRYSSGDVDGWHYQIDARSSESPGKWGGFAAPMSGGLDDGFRVPHSENSLDSAIRGLNAKLRDRNERVTADGSANMTVAQLIEALQHMPPDAPIITHANNHSTGLGTNNDQRVASRVVYGREVVLIGNWSSYTWNGWSRESMPGEVWTVKTWGERAGVLVRGTLELVPEKETSYVSTVKTPSHYEIKDSE